MEAENDSNGHCARRKGELKVNAGRLIAVVGVLLLVSACSAVEAFYARYAPVQNIACEERTARQLEGIEFTDVPRIEMIVRHGEFSPMILRLTKGRAYVLRLRNRDTEARSFNAAEFFDNIAVAAVALDNDILPTVCPGPVVEMQPGQSFEMQFLAATDGVYEYRDTGSTGLQIGNFLNAAPPGGIIRIEESY